MLKNDTILLGISGRIGSGKSTVASFLMGLGVWRTIRFADVLKDMTGHVLTSFGYNQNEVKRMIDGDLKEVMIPEVGTTPRRIMQTIGTDFRDRINKSLWFDIANGRQKNIRSQEGLNVVIDDIRFYDPEVINLKKEKAILWKISRPGVRVVSNNALEDFARISEHGNLYDYDAIKAIFIEAFDLYFTPRVNGFAIGALNGMTLDQARREFINFFDKDIVPILNKEVSSNMVDNHISEQMPDDKYFDKVFVNDGTVADLSQKIGNEIVMFDTDRMGQR